jgi:hypothetical protein
MLGAKSTATNGRMSRVICQKRNFPNENFQPFALATPLYSINFRLIGGELLGCAQ